MAGKKSKLLKRAGVSRRIPKKKAKARAIIFHYARGEETISTTPSKYGKP
jgi:hypothetical protein